MADCEGRSESAGSDLEDLSDDVLYEVLSDSRRRYALVTLSRRDASVALADLAREIASREADDDDDDAAVPAEASQRVLADLYHVHVPKLVEADLTEFDRAKGTVTPVDIGEPLETALESLVSSR